jgi:hypothetical protein
LRTTSPSPAGDRRGAGTLVADRDGLSRQISHQADRAVDANDNLQRLGKQAGDRAQPALRTVFGKSARAGVSHRGEVGLDKARFDLAAGDKPHILHRSLRRLRDRDQARNATIATTRTGRTLDWARNRAGHHSANLEERAAGRRRANPEKAGLDIGRRTPQGGKKKQTGASEAAPATS